jgi:hypothetical protein
MADLEKIVEQLSALSVLEAAELVKKLEEKWGVSAAAPVAVAAAAGAPAAAAEAVEEKTEFDVVIKDAGRSRQRRRHGRQEEVGRSRRSHRSQVRLFSHLIKPPAFLREVFGSLT